MRLAAILLAACLISPSAFAQTLSGAGACNKPIAEAETRLNLPKGLLYAIATVESVYRDPQTNVRAPWPWTINAGGVGRFHPSIDEAKAAVVRELSRNVDSVDVGCMQVNLRAHPKTFSSLDLAFDPNTNVAAGADILLANYNDTNSWSEAIRRYHAPAGSPNGILYLSKVMAYWRGSLGKPAPPLREALDTTPSDLDDAAKAFEKGDYANALARYSGILKKDPDSRIGHLGLAMASDKLGDSLAALDHYRRVLIYDPYNRTALDALMAEAASQPPTRRLQKLAELKGLAPGMAEIPALMAGLYAEMGHLTEAARHLAEALEIEPQQTVWRLNLASIYDRLGEREAAIGHYSRFLKDYKPGTAPVPVAIEDIKSRVAWLMDN
ncbi:MAG: tetratricopeptide repeat protein [Rhodospirillales bacterium]|jgi:tetratricopeptide (TPR) repeat protein